MLRNKEDLNLKKKSRKVIRKEERFQKKQRKVHFFTKKKELRDKWKKDQEPGRFVRIQKIIEDPLTKRNDSKLIKNQDDKKVSKNVSNEHELEKQKLKKLQKEMKHQRKRTLHKENKEEDKNIKQLEKKLKINKRKSKAIPKSFVECGLDYILDVCDSKNIVAAVNAEMNLKDSDSEYEEDLALITGRENKSKNKLKSLKNKEEDSKVDDFEDNHSESSIDDEEVADEEFDEEKENEKIVGGQEQFFENNMNESEYSLNDDETSDICYKKKISYKTTTSYENQKSLTNMEVYSRDKSSHNEKRSILKKDSNDDKSKVENVKRKWAENENVQEKRVRIQSESRRSSRESDLDDQGKNEAEGQEYWEDIYGRTRDKAGNIVQVTNEKYIPPHLREKSANSKRREELEKIKKQLKGHLNRLAENNMHSISNQIDEMYMKNSRNDMNETILNLYKDSLIMNVQSPERLIMEHAMLVAILHANVGTEIGAFFLQNLVKEFDEQHNSEQEIKNKKLDNLILFLSHLYTFKVYNCELLYDILNRLCDSFTPKDVDLILVVLRSVGFTLRKDDPIALKQLIMRVQKLANEATVMKDDARMRFMLEVLLGIKNNNMNKLPGYDPSHAEHLKKIIKAMFRKGNYVTELKISLEDILKADERGRWWIVGSAWSGPAPNASVKDDLLSLSSNSLPSFSQEVLDLAKKQRMSTCNRKNIFCILITAEDYLDAFEKLIRLGLKGQPEQEIVHVLIHCLLNEKIYNPYYALIAEQLCISDRRHQMTIQFSVWDRFKELKSLRKGQITNLAKFLAHLFLQKSLPISVLKVVEFVELDKPGVRLIRQVLMTLLLHEDKDSMLEVFKRIVKPTKLCQLRQSLALFLHHFILRSKSDSQETSQEEIFLQQRVEEAINVLNASINLK